MVNTDLLKKVYLFEGFSESELQAIAGQIREKEMIAGDYVFDEGSTATAMYIVKQGTVEILKKGTDDEQKVAAFSGGSHFGEMAFLDRSPRAASAMAKENLKLLELPYAGLEQLIQGNKELGLKFYRNAAQSLSRRVRQTTTDLSTLKELKLRHL